MKSRNTILTSSTVVLIVSDAKTLEADKMLEQLKLFEKKAKRIIWFNPLQEKYWGSIPNIEKLKKICTVFDCSTLEKLAKVCELL